MSKLKVVAGMPAYNESKYIGSVVVATRQYVDEVIVVDDGSSDNTSEIARLAGARVVTHTRNKGYGAAVKSIIATAREADADILVLIDSDGQHNPAEIPDLIEPIREGYDFVTGTRKDQGDNIPLYRRVGQGVILSFINLLSRDKLSDSECGFRAFSRKALSILDLQEDGMAISAETVAKVSSHNLKVAEVPVTVAYTGDSSTLNPLSHGLGVLTKIIVMISEQRPLFFFGMAGVILVVCGMVAGIVTLRLFTSSGVVSIGWTLVSIFLLIMGTLSFFTGLTLHTIASIIHNAISRDRQR